MTHNEALELLVTESGLSPSEVADDPTRAYLLAYHGIIANVHATRVQPLREARDLLEGGG